MILDILSYNGVNINDGSNYTAWWDGEGPVIYGAQMTLTNRARQFPLMSGKTLAGRAYPLQIKCLGTAHAQVQTLKALFDPADETERTLICRDTSDSNKQYRLMVTCQDMPELLGEAVLSVNLFAANPIWEAVTPSTASQTFTTSGTTMNVTPGGNLVAQPRITVTPQTAKASNNWAYRRFVSVPNITNLSAPDYPVDLTGGGLNTSSLYDSGKIQQDMDDWRAIDNGVEIDRWLSATTAGAAVKLWANITFAPGIKMTLLGAIASSGAYTDIKIKKTSANAAALKRMPDSGIIVIDSEVWTYSGKSTKLYALYNGIRAAKGTSMAAHSDGANIYWIEHDLWMLYGNPSATAPDVDDTKKPMFDLVNSTNTSWAWNGTTGFYDDAGVRTGAWKPTVISTTGKESDLYTATHGAAADPATVLGLAMRAWQKSGKWQSESAVLEARLTNPFGITHVTSNGDKRRVSANWPGKVLLQRSNTSTFVDVWSEASPASANSWTAWTHSSVALGAAYRFIRFLLSGSIGASASNEIDFETQAVTVTVDSTKVPPLTLVAELGTYYMDMTLTNQLTGDILTLKWAATTGQAIVIDCAAKTVLYSDGSNAFGAFDRSSLRKSWFDLLPGQTNTIKFEDTGMGNVLVAFSWPDRMN